MRAVDALDDDGWAPLHYAAWYGHDGAVAVLLARGALVSISNPGGATPLHLASGCGRLACVDALLSAGADASIRDKELNTPADLARSLRPERWEETVQKLGRSV